MALTLPVGSSGNGDFKRAPAGSHIAVCNLVADMGDTPGTTGHQVALVRDAVAELMEADREYDAIRARDLKYPCTGMSEHIRRVKGRRAAALARCGGAA